MENQKQLKRTKTSYEKSRIRELLWYMIEEHQPSCTLCGKQFSLSTDLPSRGSDNLTIHHQDGNHYNNSLGNRVLVHRSCHKAHHTKNNINFWRQFR